MARSNCLFWAVGRWWKEGGYVLATKSRYGWWPHFLWSPDLKTFHAWTAPPAYYQHYKQKRRWIPPLFFPGYVRQLDHFTHRGAHGK